MLLLGQKTSHSTILSIRIQFFTLKPPACEHNCLRLYYIIQKMGFTTTTYVIGATLFYAQFANSAKQEAAEGISLKYHNPGKQPQLS